MRDANSRVAGSPSVKHAWGDEARLVRKARAGSLDAASTLFHRHFDAVWETAYRVTGHRALADDAAQEAFVRAFGALDRFDEQRPLAPWLARIAVNRAIDLLHKQRGLHLVDPGELAQAEPARDQPRADDEVTAAVGRLDLPKRVVIVLHYWVGYTLEEIATMLALPVGTVASRLSRGLADLRSDLEVRRANSA